jgi:hypothetical protein
MTAACHAAIRHQVVVGKLHQMGFGIGITLTGTREIGEIRNRVAQYEEILAVHHCAGDFVATL